MSEDAMPEDHSVEETAEKKISRQVNRRKFVRSLGLAGGLAAGGTTLGTAKAQERPEPLSPEEIAKAQSDFESSKEMRQSIKQPYKELEIARRAVDAHAEVVLQTLFKRKFLNHSSATEFGALNGHGQPFNHENASLTAIKSEDEWTAVLRFTEGNDNHEIDLYVLPEVGRSYAFVRNLNGEEEYIVDREIEGNITSSSPCHEMEECHDYDPNESCHIDSCFEDLGVVETFYTHTINCCPDLGTCYFVEKNCIIGECEKVHGICV